MSGREQDFIKEAFDTNWVVPMGPNVTGFEKDLEAFVNKRHAMQDVQPDVAEKCDSDMKPLDKKVVCLSAGTAAVHLALIACGVGAGDDVLVQSFTFCASSHPITYLGATPVFIDSERGSWNMDLELLEEAIKDRIHKKDGDLVGQMVSEGTTPRRLTDLIGSLCDLTSGSGDKGTPVVFIQGYFDNYTTE